jgi:hypothetical protein
VASTTREEVAETLVQRNSQLPLLMQRVFGSVVAVAFQITFRAEMHANDFFFIFKKSFLTSVHQNDPKHINHIKF